MGTDDTLRAKLSLIATRIYARSLGGMIGHEWFEIDGVEGRVCYVDSDRWHAAGQGLPTLSIILNEAKLKDKPNRVREYVFLHESGHKRWPFPVQLLFFLAQFLLALAIISVTMALPQLIVNLWWGATPNSLVVSFLGTILGVALMVAIPLSVTWIDEGSAELFTISKLGIENYREVREEFAGNHERGIAARVWGRVAYPPESLLLWIAERLYEP